MAYANFDNVTTTALTGVAPHYVLVDLSQITLAGTTYPFHAAWFCVDWGDDTAYTYGVTWRDARRSYAPIAAHAYATAGTYTATAWVLDPTNGNQSHEPFTVIVGAGTYTDYYFADDGLDGNTGLNQDNPKQTTTAMIALAAAGVRINLKKGDTWTAPNGGVDFGTVVGTATSPFVVRSVAGWGTGADPIIIASATPTGNHVLQFNDVTFGKAIGLKVDGNGMLDSGIRPGDRNFIYQCEIANAYYSMSLSAPSAGLLANGFCVADCNFHDSRHYHIYGPSENAAMKNVALLASNLDTTSENATSEIHAAGRIYWRHSAIERCDVNNWAKNATSTHAGILIGAVETVVDDDEAEFVSVWGSKFAWNATTGGGPALWVGSTEADDADAIKDVRVSCCEFDIPNTGTPLLHRGCTRLTFDNFVIRNALNATTATGGTANQDMPSFHMRFGSVYSTATGSPGATLFYRGDSGVGDLEASDFQSIGNIFLAASDTSTTPIYDWSGANAMVIADVGAAEGNCYREADGAPTNPYSLSGVDYTLAALQALDLEAGSITADPLYADAPTDMTLQVGSPCRSIAALDGYALDFLGCMRPAGTYPCMGAYEYGGSAWQPGAIVALVHHHTNQGD